jgi:hypothetical protein
MLEAQAAAQAEQARLLSQLRSKDNDLKLARLEAERSRWAAPGGGLLACKAPAGSRCLGLLGARAQTRSRAGRWAAMHGGLQAPACLTGPAAAARRAQLELAASDVERSHAERDAATRALGRSEYEAKRLTYELGQRDLALKALRDQVRLPGTPGRPAAQARCHRDCGPAPNRLSCPAPRAPRAQGVVPAAEGGGGTWPPQVDGLVAQVKQMEQHQRRVIELPLADVLAASSTTAAATPRGGSHAARAAAAAAVKVPPALRSIAPGAAASAAAATGLRPPSPRETALLSPRCGASGAEGAEPDSGGSQGVLLPVDTAQKLAEAAIAEAAAAAAELAVIDGRNDELQQQASAVVAAVADKLDRRLAEATSASLGSGSSSARQRASGADIATGWMDERMEGLVREATDALQGFREQQKQLLAGRWA